MLLRCFSLSLLFLALISATALADGGFYGSITYDNCDCTLQIDRVNIRPVGSQDLYVCYVDCLRQAYNTSGCPPVTFPPGSYEMWPAAKDCYSYWPPKVVVHGEDWQEVNFTVHGPSGTPDGGGGD